MTWQTQRLVLIGLIVILGATVWLMRSVPPSTLLPDDEPTGQNDSTATAPDPDPAPALPESAEAVDTMLTPRGAEAMDAPPAGLPMYPDANKLIAYRQRLDGAVQELTAWSIPQTAGEPTAVQVADFYREAAAEAGFEPVSTSAEGPANLVLRRGEQTLMVRARSAGPSIRVSLILRYTMQPIDTLTTEP